MHFYALFDLTEAKPTYHGTLAQAQEAGKKTPPVFRPDLRIHLVDINTTKDSLLFVLNNPAELNQLMVNEKPLRIYTLSRRGGIKEITE